MNFVKNPILPGFNPDPSICCANGKFFIVNSTFSYFPGVPIYESEDLQHFKLIGNILDRKEQLPLMGCTHSAGIFAPTIRFHDGIFYMITTNVSHKGNFVVTATNPEGPWSDPHYIEGADGIDPSLFFDDDGSCYYIGTRPNPEGVKYNGDWFIYIQKFDVNEMKLVGDYKIVWNGALKNAIWPEGPHLYKKDGYYYLLHAEGGTGFNHAISVARSKEVFGPYEGNPCNPVFSHRMLGQDYPIQNVGHVDMAMAPNGDWFAVMLASRPIENKTTLGRETFLANIVWENEWPVFNPIEGKLFDMHPVSLPKKDFVHTSTALHFNNSTLDKRIIGLRLVDDTMYSLSEHKDYLRLYMRNVTLDQQLNPSYLAIRQQHQSFMVETMIDICFDGDASTAGLAVVQSNEANLQFTCRYQLEGVYITALTVTKRISDTIKNEKICNLPANGKLRIFMKIQKIDNSIKLLYALENSEDYIEFASGINTEFLSTENAGGFVGCTVGMYAVGAEGSSGYADYGWFTYDGIE